ncbi:Pleiotropic regulator 1 [Perkinsus olseni]|uniref:Pleiotropic regulator 1 n=1 Tax=Perkinsus olseni TaxID=32597 RepID=A0A7J6PCM2_PEROL|nr:Pleiotropic regulator 1 [Perkinsus olseni]
MASTTAATAAAPSSSSAEGHQVKFTDLVKLNQKRTLELWRPGPEPHDIYPHHVVSPPEIREAKQRRIFEDNFGDVDLSVTKMGQKMSVLNLPTAGAAAGPAAELPEVKATSTALVAAQGVNRLPGESRLVARTAGTTAKGILAIHENIGRHRPKQQWHPDWNLYRVVQGHQGWVRALDVDPSNEFFVSGGNDKMIKVWDLATGTLKLTLTGHIHNIRGLKLHPRLKYLFSCGEDNMVKCWDLEMNTVVRSYHGHLSGVYCMETHPTLDVLFTGSRDATVRVWDIRTKHAIHVLGGHTSTVNCLASQQMEPQVISGSMDSTIRLWDLKAGKCRTTLTHHKKGVRALAVHPRLPLFASAAADHIKVWRSPDGVFERNIDHNIPGTVMHCLKIRDEGDSPVMVAGTDAGHLLFWDWASGQIFQDINTPPQPGSMSSERSIYALAFDKSGERLITGECDKTIKMYKQDYESSKSKRT